MLNQFGWHDLPLDLITIDSSGVRLVISPYNEELKEYVRFELHLYEFEKLELSLGDKVTFSALSDMEIADFSYVENGNLLSGEIGILPANQGYWKIKFKSANWCLVRCV